jgi:hypothetical protein
MHTLDDALASIIAEWQSQPRELHAKNSPRVYRQRRVGEFLTEIFGADERNIPVEYGGALRKILAHA